MNSKNSKQNFLSLTARYNYHSNLLSRGNNMENSSRSRKRLSDSLTRLFRLPRLPLSAVSRHKQVGSRKTSGRASHTLHSPQRLTVSRQRIYIANNRISHCHRAKAINSKTTNHPQTRINGTVGGLFIYEKSALSHDSTDFINYEQ